MIEPRRLPAGAPAAFPSGDSCAPPSCHGNVSRPGPPQFRLRRQDLEIQEMKKTYVLDTNVLLHDPRAIFRFEDNDVIVPIFCIEEVDQFKREGSERGRNARQIARLLDDLRESGGSLSKGVPNQSGGTLRVAVPKRRPELASALDKSSMDAAILQTAFDVREQDGGRPTIFVTMDTNLRIRADALGMVAENYENQRVEVDSLDSGVKELEVDAKEIDAFFHEGRLAPKNAGELRPNLCVLLRDR